MKSLPTLAPDHAADGASPPLPPCLDRRAFLANSGLLAVGAVLASACGDGQLGGTPTSPVGGITSVTVRPADYPALGTVGGIARLNGTVRPVALVRASATEYRAYSMICTHEGTTINIVNNGTSFLCPNHGAMFANTGRWTGGQLTSNLLQLTIVADATAGTLTITY